ncbi:2-nitropropane dioxygenase [Sphingomonas sp. DBB INV C78]|uniref:NAD(P)H-dependent flavin oxidoreductase n=1 Tax=Sphingomonas sp. DBB INV C78 TaxID=3349434 RepID=UPI0036D42E10
MVSPGAFIERIGAAHPILLAPMAGAGGVGLAAAAMAGGAAGALPCSLLTPGALRSQYEELRSRASGPINLNFFCHRMGPPPDESVWKKLLAPFYADCQVGPPVTPPPIRAPFDGQMADVVAELKPEIISFHFGLPDEPLLERARASGALIIASATSVSEARWLANQGVDAVIAQGWEAGGHAGRFLGGDPAHHMGLMALIPQIVDVVDVPVIAAGGIADGRGIAAALMLGASAVQIGTAYLHCPESLIHEPHRAALTSDAAERTMFTNLFTGGLARGVPNRLMTALGPIREEAPPFPYAANALARLRTVDPGGFGPLWSGQASRLSRPLPARTLTEQMAADALALLGRTGKGWPV